MWSKRRKMYAQLGELMSEQFSSDLE
ncbi:hypothetical protein EMIT0P4_40183 [Pseudomonas sp. IT-P4]